MAIGWVCEGTLVEGLQRRGDAGRRGRWPHKGDIMVDRTEDISSARRAGGKWMSLCDFFPCVAAEDGHNTLPFNKDGQVLYRTQGDKFSPASYRVRRITPSIINDPFRRESPPPVTAAPSCMCCLSHITVTTHKRFMRTLHIRQA